MPPRRRNPDAASPDTLIAEASKRLGMRLTRWGETGRQRPPDNGVPVPVPPSIQPGTYHLEYCARTPTGVTPTWQPCGPALRSHRTAHDALTHARRLRPNLTWRILFTATATPQRS